MSDDLKAVDPRQLTLRSPREEFLDLVASRLQRLEDAGEEEQIRVLEAARQLGEEWLPTRPGGGRG